MLINKTYEDAASYFMRGDTIVFTRPLGIKRNSVVVAEGIRADLIELSVAGVAGA